MSYRNHDYDRDTEHKKTSLAGKIGRTLLGLGLGGGAVYGAGELYTLYSVGQNEIIMQTTGGKITRVAYEPGFYQSGYLDRNHDFDRSIRYVEITDTDTNLLTAQSQPFKGSFKVGYIVDKPTNDAEAIRSAAYLKENFNFDEGRLSTAVFDMARQVAIEVVGDTNTLDLTGNIGRVSAEVKRILQERATEAGMPITITLVSSSGADLDPKLSEPLAEVLLKEKRVEAQKLDKEIAANDIAIARTRAVAQLVAVNTLLEGFTEPVEITVVKRDAKEGEDAVTKITVDPQQGITPELIQYVPYLYALATQGSDAPLSYTVAASSPNYKGDNSGVVVPAPANKNVSPEKQAELGPAPEPAQ